MIQCSKCKAVKSESDFWKQSGKKNGYRSRCKDCDRPYQQGWKQKKLYGITVKQRSNMYVGQNGCCAICGESIPYDKIYTDHDHKTGRVRGLLCCKCNLKLAVLDDKEFVIRATKYIGDGE